MKKYSALIYVLFLTLCSCQHKTVNPKLSSDWRPLTKKNRFSLIKKATKNIQQYNGLDLLFDMNVTFLNEKILKDNLKIKSQYMMWDLQQAQDEESKLNIYKLNQSQFFVTLYSNNRNINQLNLKASDWRANIIMRDGTIHKGSIELHDNLKDHNIVFYPYVESWDKKYLVTFKVPTSDLMTKRFILDVSSPRGAARFNY